MSSITMMQCNYDRDDEEEEDYNDDYSDDDDAGDDDGMMMMTKAVMMMIIKCQRDVSSITMMQCNYDSDDGDDIH